MATIAHLSKLPAGLSGLSERRKADRNVMAHHVATLCAELGVPNEFEREPPPHQCVWVRISHPSGVRLNIDFDGKSCQPDVFVLSWHMDCSDLAGPAPKFAATFGSPNTVHWHKSTDVVRGFPELLWTLHKRLTALNDGAAFQPKGNTP